MLCSEIWSIVETCVREQDHLLVPFWETVLERPPEEMKTQIIMASHFSKINSTFLTKKPDEASFGLLIRARERRRQLLCYSC